MISLAAPLRHRYVLTVGTKPIASSSCFDELLAYRAFAALGGFGRIHDSDELRVARDKQRRIIDSMFKIIDGSVERSR